MRITAVNRSKSQLSKLIDKALEGEEITIAKAGIPVARLVAIRPETSPRVGGQWRGRVKIADDFDSLPNDIAAAFGVEPP